MPLDLEMNYISFHCAWRSKSAVMFVSSNVTETKMFQKFGCFIGM